jgi:hypothetical protein
VIDTIDAEWGSLVIEPVNPLPIQPKVTPAMGLAGALLLCTGLVYAVIGIKNKWYVQQEVIILLDNNKSSLAS